jgi:hypothetical protein
MELAFGQAPPGDRWRDCGARLVMLAETLKASAPPDWVDPPAREGGKLDSVIDAHLLLSMDGESEDEKHPFPSLALHSSSPAGPSTSASAIAPSARVAVAASPSSHQGLPAHEMAPTSQIPRQLQSELNKTHHSLRSLTITNCTFTTFFFIGYLIKSLLIIRCGLPCCKLSEASQGTSYIGSSRNGGLRLIARVRDGCWSASRQHFHHPRHQP